MRSLHHDFAAVAMRAADRGVAENPALFVAEAGLAQLQELQAAFQRMLERGEHRRIRGKHRREHRVAGPLPRDRLLFPRMRVAFPRNHPEEPQPHGTVRLRFFRRSEEHTSELQSPYVISYAVFCLKKTT